MSAPLSALRRDATEGHQLLVVMNESRLLDTKMTGEWVSRYVGPRQNVQKGVYDLTGAEKPARNVPAKTYDGNVLHVSSQHVFQVSANDKGKSTVVKHDRALFRAAGREEIPPVGARLTMTYERGQGRVVRPQLERDR